MISQLKSLIEASEDRVRSPWFGSVLIAWMCINWKMLAILFFSKTTVEQKLTVVVESHYSIELWIVYPLLVAALFTLISPVISFAVFQLNHFFKVRQEIVKKKSELTVLEYESELNFRKKKLELIEHERFGDLDDYSIKKERINKLDSGKVGQSTEA